jgi:putative GTP pyrophosphokinase
VEPRECPTKSQVNRAGRKLRKFLEGFEGGGELSLADDIDVDRALDTVLAYRAAHQYPLGKATMGLRSMVNSEHCELEISQRLKRSGTILDKLLRQPTMQLANMQDIGGCRAVLNSIDEVRRVERRLKKNRPPVRVSDYISAPKISGYRAVHVIVEYDGRMIEIQLRTRVMHEWAITVERLTGRLQQDFKSGLGSIEINQLMGAISEAMAVEEGGEVVDPVLLTKVNELRKQAEPYLRGGGG